MAQFRPLPQNSSMILIGQYDSPFVRRVAVALRLYGFDYEHRPWSVFRDTDKIAELNPTRRVPTFVADDGEVLTDSSAILDWLDSLVGLDRALIAAGGPERRAALKVCAFATSVGDKAVSLVYEKLIHERATPMWIARCQAQIAGIFDALDTDRAARPGPWWFGDRLGHADIAVACVIRFTREAHPEAFDPARWPALAAHAAACEALADFQAVAQPFFVALPES